MQANTESQQPVIEFGVTEAALSELKNTYSSVPDANTTSGYEEIQGALKVLTPLRTGIEKKRKALKADALAWGKKVDGEAKRITEILSSLEAPLKSAKSVVDERKKREKEERIARLQKKVDAISAYPQTAFGQSSTVIAQLIEELDAFEIEDFYDLSKEAAIAKAASLDKLTEMLQTAISQDREDAARKQEEQRQAEERKRLDEERAEFERQQAAFREQQAELERQKPEVEVVAEQTAPVINHHVQPTEMSKAKPEESSGVLFEGKELTTCVTTYDEREALQRFFGGEGMHDLYCDKHGNEYELEVVVRRVKTKTKKAA
ncbi:MAG: hypothetical protein ACRBBW_12975 [Cellvibrionaceae bacterium]